MALVLSFNWGNLLTLVLNFNWGSLVALALSFNWGSSVALVLSFSWRSVVALVLNFNWRSLVRRQAASLNSLKRPKLLTLLFRLCNRTRALAHALRARARPFRASRHPDFLKDPSDFLRIRNRSRRGDHFCNYFFRSSAKVLGSNCELPK